METGRERTARGETVESPSVGGAFLGQLGQSGRRMQEVDEAISREAAHGAGANETACSPALIEQEEVEEAGGAATGSPLVSPWPARRAAWVELLMVGGLTPLLYPLSWLVRRAFGLDGPELAVGFVMFHAAFLINDPHFAVTYLLFYDDVRGRALGPTFSGLQRARYVVVGFVVPLALVAWGALALWTHSAATLGALLSSMFLLVGWHYVKQGFGLFVLLAARRGVVLGPRERLAVLAHCFAGWAYAWASPADPGTRVEEKGVVFTTIARSPLFERATLVVLLATIPPLLVVLVQKRLREGPRPLLTPLVAMLASVWAWSIYSSIDPLVRYVVPALHSVQYLYVVWLLKKTQAVEREGSPYFELAAPARLGGLAVLSLLLGWVLFHGAPTVLDDMLGTKRTALTDLGPTPYFAAVFAFVNIHHYFMDTVLWRRENPLTRYLRPASPRVS